MPAFRFRSLFRRASSDKAAGGTSRRYKRAAAAQRHQDPVQLVCCTTIATFSISTPTKQAPCKTHPSPPTADHTHSAASSLPLSNVQMQALSHYSSKLSINKTHASHRSNRTPFPASAPLSLRHHQHRRCAAPRPRAAPLDSLFSIPKEAFAAGSAALIALGGAIAAVMGQDASKPAAGEQPEGERAAARENAVLVLGATGRAGRLIVQQVRLGAVAVVALVYLIRLSRGWGMQVTAACMLGSAECSTLPGASCHGSAWIARKHLVAWSRMQLAATQAQRTHAPHAPRAMRPNSCCATAAPSSRASAALTRLRRCLAPWV